MKTVLVLSANPIESIRVQFHNELSEIQQAWERSKDGFKIEFEPAATWDRWRQRLLDCKPEIVHFIGHGIGRNGLIFEGHSGQEVVSGERLAKLLLEFPTVRCVVLNACHSKVQAVEIFERVGHVQCVIGMKQTIAQESAKQFAIAFYDSVFKGCDYDASFRIAKIGINSLHDAFKPHSLTRDQSVKSVMEQKNNIRLQKPGRKMLLDSPFYIERSRWEDEVQYSLMEAGGLACIRGPQKFGKSSLVAQVIAKLKEKGALSVSINFREIEPRYLQDLDVFLRWFCRQIRRGLDLASKVDEVWDEDGGMDACRDYFEGYVLPMIPDSLILELDEVDALLEQQEHSEAWKKQFFWMLRAWFERGRTDRAWGKLRLALVHSKRIGRKTLEDSQSPFNLVDAVEIPELSGEQVKELVRRHGLSPIDSVTGILTNLVGGHPYFVSLALYEMVKQRSSIESVLSHATTRSGLYGSYLEMLRKAVEKDSRLVVTLKALCLKHPVDVDDSLDSEGALQDLGIVRLCGDHMQFTCELYRAYFTTCWS